jgi:hypothetical protein
MYADSRRSFEFKNIKMDNLCDAIFNLIAVHYVNR